MITVFDVIIQLRLGWQLISIKQYARYFHICYLILNLINIFLKKFSYYDYHHFREEEIKS